MMEIGFYLNTIRVSGAIVSASGAQNSIRIQTIYNRPIKVEKFYLFEVFYNFKFGFLLC